MQALLGLFGGALLGAGLVATLGRRVDSERPSLRASALAWTSIGFGATALLMVVTGIFAGPIAGMLGVTVDTVTAMPAALSITFAVASVIAALGAWARHDRHWPTWVGIVVGGLPVLFWLAFLIGEIVVPH